MAARKVSVDGDDYWEEQTAKKGPTRRNIFDDDVSFERAKEILTASQPKDDDEEDEDMVTWSGDPVVKFNKPRSADQGPDLRNLAIPFTPTAGRTSALTPSAPSSSSFSRYDKAANMSHNRSQSLGGNTNHFGVNTSQISRGISDPSIEEVVSTSGKKQPTSSDIEKLQKEIIFLRKELQIAKRERWRKPPVDEMVRRMVLGQPYSFELYKSKEDKLNLLDKAIESHDGNAIIAALLFFKKTVKASLFNLSVTRRPVAVSHYLCYLKRHFDYAQLVDVLGMLGRSEEAAMFKYKLACQSKDATVKIGCLKTCHRAHFSSEPGLARQAALVQEHINLLERQRPIEIYKGCSTKIALKTGPIRTYMDPFPKQSLYYDREENAYKSPKEDVYSIDLKPLQESDANEEARGQSQIFRDFPRRASVFDQPVTTTLYYFCLYHYDLGENSLASPQALRNQHHENAYKSPKEDVYSIDLKPLQISDKQFLMTAIGARAKIRRWKDIESLLTAKGWFGGTKLKALIGFDKVSEILHKNKAPHDVLAKYVALIEDLNLRVSVAKKVECPKAIIDALVAVKDRAQLEAYANKLKRHSPEGLYASDVLRSSENAYKSPKEDVYSIDLKPLQTIKWR